MTNLYQVVCHDEGASPDLTPDFVQSRCELMFDFEAEILIEFVSAGSRNVEIAVFIF